MKASLSSISLLDRNRRQHDFSTVCSMVFVHDGRLRYLQVAASIMAKTIKSLLFLTERSLGPTENGSFHCRNNWYLFIYLGAFWAPSQLRRETISCRRPYVGFVSMIQSGVACHVPNTTSQILKGPIRKRKSHTENRSTQFSLHTPKT
jgi:hypothetical protein